MDPNAIWQLPLAVILCYLIYRLIAVGQKLIDVFASSNKAQNESLAKSLENNEHISTSFGELFREISLSLGTITDALRILTSDRQELDAFIEKKFQKIEEKLQEILDKINVVFAQLKPEGEKINDTKS